MEHPPSPASSPARAHLRAALASALVVLVVGLATILPHGTAQAAPTCFGERPTKVGTPGPDDLRGTSRRDVIVGRGGDDVLRGLRGGDLLCGNGGRDRIVGGRGADRIAGSGGDDTLDGDEGSDVLRGGLGDDACFPGRGPGALASCAPLLGAAGDIACDPKDKYFNGGKGAQGRCRMLATSNLLVDADLRAVLALGDTQYENGAFQKYWKSYHPTWGRVKAITRPVVGNHEYKRPGAAGYFSYFGSKAGPRGAGYYSWDVGGWHLVALNSECAEVPCGEGSAQNDWLEADLASHPAACTLAYWHTPRFAPRTNAPLQDLYAAGVELALTGHRHLYERHTPLGPTGSAEPQRGIRLFVVGTGGKSLNPHPTYPDTVERASNKAFGVLHVALLSDGYAWRFVPAAGDTFTDRGSASCH